MFDSRQRVFSLTALACISGGCLPSPERAELVDSLAGVRESALAQSSGRHTLVTLGGLYSAFIPYELKAAAMNIAGVSQLNWGVPPSYADEKHIEFGEIVARPPLLWSEVMGDIQRAVERGDQIVLVTYSLGTEIYFLEIGPMLEAAGIKHTLVLYDALGLRDDSVIPLNARGKIPAAAETVLNFYSLETEEYRGRRLEAHDCLSSDTRFYNVYMPFEHMDFFSCEVQYTVGTLLGEVLRGYELPVEISFDPEQHEAVMQVNEPLP